MPYTKKYELVCSECGKKFFGIKTRVVCSNHCGGKRSRRLHPSTGDKNPRWNGGRVINKGHVYVYSPNHPNATKLGYVMEHRLVMEKCLGRYLSKLEVVHHKNEDRADNRIENLMVVSSQEHNRIHLCGKPSRAFGHKWSDRTRSIQMKIFAKRMRDSKTGRLI